MLPASAGSLTASAGESAPPVPQVFCPPCAPSDLQQLLHHLHQVAAQCCFRPAEVCPPRPSLLQQLSREYSTVRPTTEGPHTAQLRTRHTPCTSQSWSNTRLKAGDVVVDQRSFQVTAATGPNALPVPVLRTSSRDHPAFINNTCPCTTHDE
ncbi:MAG: hypothetical protein WDW38_003482 [Sanguina aurantia]